MSARRRTLLGWWALLYAASLFVAPRLVTLVPTYVLACVVTEVLARQELLLERRTAGRFVGLTILALGLSLTLRWQPLARAEGLASIGAWHRAKAQLDGPVAVFPSRIREDVPQQVYVRAEGAERVSILGVPGHRLGPGVFRVPLRSAQVTAALDTGAEPRLVVDGQPNLRFDLHRARRRPGALCQAADGRVTVVSTSTDELLAWSSTPRSEGAPTVARTRDRPMACAYAPDGARVVAFEDGRLTRDGRTWRELGAPLRAFAMDRRGRWAAAIGGDAPRLVTAAGDLPLPAVVERLVTTEHGVAYARGAAIVARDFGPGGALGEARVRRLGRPPLRLVGGDGALALTTTLFDVRPAGNHEIVTETVTLQTATLRARARTRHDAGRALCGISDGAALLVDSIGPAYCAGEWRSSPVEGRVRRGADVVLEVPVDDEVRRGERAFHEPTRRGVACASCHPMAGAESPSQDGAWHDIGHAAPRPSRDVRGVAGTPPYLRDGSYADLRALAAFPEEVLGGYAREDARRPEDVAAFLASLVRPAEASPVDAEAGYRVFVRAGCPDCHAAPAFTDLRSWPAARVRSDEVPVDRIDTPSLIGAGDRGRGLGGDLPLEDFLPVHAPELRLDAAERAALTALLRSL